MGWGNNRWLSTRPEAVHGGHARLGKYKCIGVLNEGYTGNVLTSWIRHIQKILLGIQKQSQMNISME